MSGSICEVGLVGRVKGECLSSLWYGAYKRSLAANRKE